MTGNLQDVLWKTKELGVEGGLNSDLKARDYVVKNNNFILEIFKKNTEKILSGN